MKKSPVVWVFIMFVGIVLYGASAQKATADIDTQSQANYAWRDQVAANSNQATPLPITEVVATPEARIMPPVWSNAGLVLGASVLVLIIVGGVLGARLRRKH